jgi:hypothetical protein
MATKLKLPRLAEAIQAIVNQRVEWEQQQEEAAAAAAAAAAAQQVRLPVSKGGLCSQKLVLCWCWAGSASGRGFNQNPCCWCCLAVCDAGWVPAGR